MTIAAWLKRSIAKLKAAGIATARLDALVLLENRLGIDRAHLLAHPELKITERDKNVLNHQIDKRAEHQPLAYLLGRTEFYGRDFIITPAVLEPRPESETIIDLLKELVLEAPEFAKRPHGAPNISIADVGAGSGALGITAKLELPGISVDLLEIDERAIGVAKKNVIKHATSISVITSNLLRQAPRSYDILLCNLPYVPDSFQVNPAAMREPKIAIFGGPDGLDIYRHLFKDIQNIQQKPLYILSEALPPQHAQLADIAKRHGYRQVKHEDFIQLFAKASL